MSGEFPIAGVIGRRAMKEGLIGVAMTQAVRHIIIMVWGTGLA